jgi:hypothetical protein
LGDPRPQSQHEPNFIGAGKGREDALSRISGLSKGFSLTDRRGAKRAIPAALVAEAAERHAGGETLASLTRWLEKAHGVRVTLQCVSTSIKRLRAAPERQEPTRHEPAEVGDYRSLTHREALLTARDRLLTIINDPDSGSEAVSKACSSLSGVVGRIAALEKVSAEAPTEDERADEAKELKRRLATMRERTAAEPELARTGTQG